MPEIKKRIVIASVLKPLNDTRMTEKIAFTLAEDPSHEVHVIGFPSTLPADSRITYHTFPSFKRLSFARWLTQLRIFKTLVRIRPTIIIVATHELLVVGIVSKLLSKARLIYDVQENYYLNIRHTGAFPPLLRNLIAWYVRLKERVASAFVDHFFLAEKVYSSQLDFLAAPTTVLENKVKKIDFDTSVNRIKNHLVFSGTLSRSTGVFKAISLAKALHAVDQSVRLTIIGYAADDRGRDQIRTAIIDAPFIELIGGDRLVNHDQIIKIVSEASAGILAYEPSIPTLGRIPTKLYEYLGCGLPVIFIDSHQEWINLATVAGVEFFTVKPGFSEILPLGNWLAQSTARGTFPDSLYWKSEEIKLQTAISAL
jgi:glycosyltransferase involved in cell wall biosynthesis